MRERERICLRMLLLISKITFKSKVLILGIKQKQNVLLLKSFKYVYIHINAICDALFYILFCFTSFKL